LARKLSVKDVEVEGKRVLVRVDFNVPMDDAGNITDDRRIRASLPTIRYLLDKGASVILATHLGRPKGSVVEKLRLDPVARRLQELLGITVKKVDTVVGEDARAAAEALQPGEVLLLENTRFEPGETSNEEGLARALASLADLYVNDAFGTAHRAHASTEGVARFLPGVAGLLMQRELDMLGEVLGEAQRPFTAVLGGNKVSDKLGVINNLLGKVDDLLTGGGMCFTLMRAMGLSTGASLVEEEQVDAVREALKRAEGMGTRIHVPLDLLVADRFAEDAETRVVDARDIPEGWMGLDIGPRTVEAYREVILASRTVFWNGPMGVFEWGPFEGGTRGVAQAIADSEAVSIIGGGDSAAALRKFGLEDRVSFVSTGGGASMEYLEGKELPGVAALRDA